MPQTIEQLAKADIKVWVLTGDKQGTQLQIRYPSRVSLCSVRTTEVTLKWV